jgi:hypothetical protein
MQAGGGARTAQHVRIKALEADLEALVVDRLHLVE